MKIFFLCKKKPLMDFFFLQYAEKRIQIMKNSHRKEMAKDLLNYLINAFSRIKNKIGNLYLIKNEKYIISTLGAITTYVGFSRDGTLVAILCARKNPRNTAYFTNYLNYLKNTKLESKNIIKYVSLEEGRNHIYIAVELWDYYLDEYIENLYQPEIDQQKHDDQLKNTLKRLVQEMLLGLQAFHQAGVIHGDINPRNIVVDFQENVRIDFGRNLIGENDYSKSSDVKDAGMLVYYIHSGGKHPFGVMGDLKNDVQDIVAQDLIDWMVNNVPGINEVLKHPYFWNQKRKEEVLRKLGDQPEVQYYTDILKVCETRKAEENLTAREAVEKTFSNKKNNSRKTTILTMLGETEEVQNRNLENLSKLCDSAKKFTQGKTFNKWKSELIDEWPDINKDLPEDLLGLLRVFRNKLTHGGFDEQMFDRFPDLYISLHRLAIDMGWDCNWS